jgi:hypothetical protein
MIPVEAGSMQSISSYAYHRPHITNLHSQRQAVKPPFYWLILNIDPLQLC